MHLKQADLEFFQELISGYSPEFLATFRAQEKFGFLGHQVTLSNKDRFCTMEGILAQVADFDLSIGLIYYMDEAQRSMTKRSVILDR
jgi:hypothetical protein